MQKESICYKCRYKWVYNGKLDHYVTCPNCKSSIKPVYSLLYLKNKFKCEECGTEKDLEVHHKKPRQSGLDDNINNLRLLCNKCHSKIRISSRKNPNRKFIALNIYFEDDEFKTLKRLKKDFSWHDFILKLAKRK